MIIALPLRSLQRSRPLRRTYAEAGKTYSHKLQFDGLATHVINIADLYHPRASEPRQRRPTFDAGFVFSTVCTDCNRLRRLNRRGTSLNHQSEIIDLTTDADTEIIDLTTDGDTDVED